MTVAPERIREIFKGLENGDGAAFFEHVADDVDWTVMGTHPLAGHHHSKAAFVAGTFAKLNRVLANGARLHIDDLLVKDDQAVVKLHSEATARNDMRFDNRYCWVHPSVTLDRLKEQSYGHQIGSAGGGPGLRPLGAAGRGALP